MNIHIFLISGTILQFKHWRTFGVEQDKSGQIFSLVLYPSVNAIFLVPYFGKRSDPVAQCKLASDIGKADPVVAQPLGPGLCTCMLNWKWMYFLFLFAFFLFRCEIIISNVRSLKLIYSVDGVSAGIPHRITTR